MEHTGIEPLDLAGQPLSVFNHNNFGAVQSENWPRKKARLKEPIESSSDPSYSADHLTSWLTRDDESPAAAEAENCRNCHSEINNESTR
jgi:hypothetical protein